MSRGSLLVLYIIGPKFDIPVIVISHFPIASLLGKVLFILIVISLKPDFQLRSTTCMGC